MWKSKTILGRHAYDLESSDVDKITSKARIKSGHHFTETTGLYDSHPGPGY
jgi:hypothetical protein